MTPMTSAIKTLLLILLTASTSAVMAGVTLSWKEIIKAKICSSKNAFAGTGVGFCVFESYG